MTDIIHLPATVLAARLAAGELSAVQIMTAFLDRIDAVNPAVNAIISLRPRAELIAEAEAADRATPKGPLHGLPIAVKDLAATKGIRTTWGSPLFADFVPDKDDLLPARLKAAGAIVIGKTNTPEYGLGSHSYNPIFGVTRNPYDLGRTAGGSSGGAAAALAARMLPLADGSDMMGSLRNPSAFCNVYGFRPSWGLVPGEPMGDSFLATISTEGPMGRSPEDCALLLSVLAGPDPRSPFSRPKPDLTLETDVAGKRIGWLGNWGGAYPTEPGILDLGRAAAAQFERLGATVDEIAPPWPAESIWSDWTTLRSYVIAMKQRANYADPAKRALLKPSMIWEIERGLALSSEAVWVASEGRSSLYRAFARLFGRYDAVMLPSAQVWPFPAEWTWPERIGSHEMDSYHRWMEIVTPISLTGLPALGMPAGFSDAGLPMGVQLVGPTGSDAVILGMGQAYHEATRWPDKLPPD